MNELLPVAYIDLDEGIYVESTETVAQIDDGLLGAVGKYCVLARGGKKYFAVPVGDDNVKV